MGVPPPPPRLSLREWRVYFTVLSNQSCKVFQASHDFPHALTSLLLSSHAFSKSHTTKHGDICRARRFVSLISYSGRSRGGAQGAPLIFRPNRGPKGRKFFWRPPPPRLSKGLDDPPPLILRSGSGTELDVARSGAASLLRSDRLFTSHSRGGPGLGSCRLC